MRTFSVVEMEQDSDESDEESVRNTEAADLQPQQKGNFTRKFLVFVDNQVIEGF